MSGKRTLETWMLFNPGICHIKKCVLYRIKNNLYHCAKHDLSHKCDFMNYVAVGNSYFSGYTCPIKQCTETGMITCQVTGHVLDKSQPEYLASAIDEMKNHENLFDLEPELETISYDDKSLCDLFVNFNIHVLMIKYNWLIGHWNTRTQECFMYCLCVREQIKQTFYNQTTFYYHSGIVLTINPEVKVPIDNKYRHFTEWKAHLKRVLQSVMRPQIQKLPITRRRQEQKKSEAPSRPIPARKRQTLDYGSF